MAIKILIRMVIVVIEYRNDWGTVRFKLDEYIMNNKISKSHLAKLADMQYKQLQLYYRNEVQRPDLFVLARICYVLECQISDIIEYIPPAK